MGLEERRRADEEEEGENEGGKRGKEGGKRGWKRVGRRKERRKEVCVPLPPPFPSQILSYTHLALTKTVRRSSAACNDVHHVKGKG